jgi:hypothetical protein
MPRIVVAIRDMHRFDDSFCLCKHDGLAQQFSDPSETLRFSENDGNLLVLPHTAIFIRAGSCGASRTVGEVDLVVCPLAGVRALNRRVIGFGSTVATATAGVDDSSAGSTSVEIPISDASTETVSTSPVDSVACCAAA